MLIDSSSRNQWNFDGEVIILGNTSFVSSKVFIFLQLHYCELYNHIPSKWDYSALSISILLTCLDLSIYYIATGLIKRIVLSKSSLSRKGPHEYENFELSLGWFRNFFWLNRLLITTNNHLSFSTKRIIMFANDSSDQWDDFDNWPTYLQLQVFKQLNQTVMDFHVVFFEI